MRHDRRAGIVRMDVTGLVGEVVRLEDLGHAGF
jgi:hypothetical protein